MKTQRDSSKPTSSPDSPPVRYLRAQFGISEPSSDISKHLVARRTQASSHARSTSKSDVGNRRTATSARQLLLFSHRGSCSGIVSLPISTQVPGAAPREVAEVRGAHAQSSTPERRPGGSFATRRRAARSSRTEDGTAISKARAHLGSAHGFAKKKAWRPRDCPGTVARRAARKQPRIQGFSRRMGSARLLLLEHARGAADEASVS